MLGIYWAFSMVSSFWSPNTTSGLQIATLSFALTIFAASGISGLVPDLKTCRKVMMIFLWMSAIFIINGLVGAGQLSRTVGNRFGGSTTSSVLFVITGGLLMPTLLWGYSTLRVRKHRNLCLLGLALVTTLCFLSGQRSGFFAGILGCMPFVFRFRAAYIVRGFFVVGLLVVLAWVATISFPTQTEFLTRRYFSLSVTGREYAWTWALQGIMNRPVIGHGAGAHLTIGFGVHNAYLQEWYNGGFLGVALFFGASIVAAVQAFSLSKNKAIPKEASDMGRLLLCWVVVLIATSFFESKLTTPSNIMPFTLVIVSVLSYRLRQTQSYMSAASRTPIPAFTPNSFR